MDALIMNHTNELTKLARYWARNDSVTVLHKTSTLPWEPGMFILEWDGNGKNWKGKTRWELGRSPQAAKSQIERWFRNISVVGSLVLGYNIDPDPRPRSLYYPFLRIGER